MTNNPGKQPRRVSFEEMALHDVSSRDFELQVLQERVIELEKENKLLRERLNEVPE
jgi:hypothetical protein